MLRAPVYARCASTGVSACDAMTEGVVLFADGDVDAARQQLWDAGKNSPPDKLKAFAATLLELGASPGAESFAEPMLQVSSLLQIQAERAAKAAPPAPPSASPAAPLSSTPATSTTPAGPPGPNGGRSPAGQPDPKTGRLELPRALTADTDPARIEGGSVSPGASPAKVPCAGVRSPSASGYCVKAIEGPFVVTDLRMSASCSNDLFVAAGSSIAPRWALSSPASSPIALHGARLFVREGEFLFIGAEAGSGAGAAKISADARCSLLWSGFRPYSGRPGDGEGDARRVPRDLGF